MATISMPFSVSPPSLSSILNPKPRYSRNSRNSSLSISLPFTFPLNSSSKRAYHFLNPFREVPLKFTPVWRVSAVSGDALPTEVNPIENSDLISTGDDGVSNIISILLFIAFISLSILTIGVIYIAVTDFLQKREKEKFEKVEAANKKKKSGKKVRPSARAGPRGFGQKIEEEDDQD